MLHKNEKASVHGWVARLQFIWVVAQSRVEPQRAGNRGVMRRADIRQAVARLHLVEELAGHFIDAQVSYLVRRGS